jgi:hypothetical protein
LPVLPPTPAAKLSHWSGLVRHVIRKLKVPLDFVESKIGPLTFDETRRIADDLERATTAKAARKILDDAHQGCTMNTRQNPRDANSPTWAAALHEQIAERVRL